MPMTDIEWLRVRGGFLRREIARLKDAEDGSFNAVMRGMDTRELAMLESRVAAAPTS